MARAQIAVFQGQRLVITLKPTAIADQPGRSHHRKAEGTHEKGEKHDIGAAKTVDQNIFKKRKCSFLSQGGVWEKRQCRCRRKPSCSAAFSGCFGMLPIAHRNLIPI